MISSQRSPLWPYLAVLTALFLLSLAVPRGWQQESESDQWQPLARAMSGPDKICGRRRGDRAADDGKYYSAFALVLRGRARSMDQCESAGDIGRYNGVGHHWADCRNRGEEDCGFPAIQRAEKFNGTSL